MSTMLGAQRPQRKSASKVFFALAEPRRQHLGAADDFQVGSSSVAAALASKVLPLPGGP